MSKSMNGLILSAQEKEFVDLAKDATIVSLGVGSLLTNSTPRVEIPGVMVIEYEDQEHAVVVWKLVIEQKKGDF